jgi:hypothetical protein
VYPLAAIGETQAPADHTAHVAQDTHEHASSSWHLMEDGVVSGMFNHQSGPRGGTEVKAPNWWMGMATATTGRSQFTLTSMFSLDRVTVGEAGYRELFQGGETLDGEPIVDRQHPHDLFMQLSAVWRRSAYSETAISLAGAPVGEPTLGPPAFMHRASAADLVLAPLGHHVFDSTHVAFGVVAAAVDRGRWTFEGSVFNGREPDENRWDFDFNQLDSVAGRVRFRPSSEWELQVSTGHLVEPEILEPGNVQRTTASASWLSAASTDRMRALTIGYGVNAGLASHPNRHAAFGELSTRLGHSSVSGRVEVLQIEGSGRQDVIAAVTGGASRDLMRWRGFEGAIGVSGSIVAAPSNVRAVYGTLPASFQIYVRFKPPAGSAGRMWNMQMMKPMTAVSHAGH